MQPHSHFRIFVPAHPAFNIYTRMTRRTTALGPICVASAVDAVDDWSADVVDENNYRPDGRVKPRRPDHALLQQDEPADVVGLYGGLTSTIPRLYELAAHYHGIGVTTVAGGQHFVDETIRDALEHDIDYVVVGEGEKSVPELLAALASGRDPASVAGIAFLRDGEVVRTGNREPIHEFEQLPLADFRLVKAARIDLYPVGWSRGCGMDCEFCTVKGRPRACSIDRVMDQISLLVEEFNARRLFIVDDLFANRRSEALRLCQRLAEYRAQTKSRLDIRVQIRLDRATDAELLHAMRAAGVTSVFVGYESPIAEELVAMNKRIKPEEMIDLTRLYHRAGFLVHGMFIFGYPLPGGISLNVPVTERVTRFRRFVRASRLDTIQVVLPIPLPGAELTRRLASQNRVYPRECVGWEYYDGNFPLFKPDEPLTPEEMQSAILQITGRFYRFRAMFVLIRNILLFPAMFLAVWNLRTGWRTWYRSWRNALLRFGGWVIIRRWTTQFKAGQFKEKLDQAKARIKLMRLRLRSPLPNRGNRS